MVPGRLRAVLGIRDGARHLRPGRPRAHDRHDEARLLLHADPGRVGDAGHALHPLHQGDDGAARGGRHEAVEAPEVLAFRGQHPADPRPRGRLLVDDQRLRVAVDAVHLHLLLHLYALPPRLRPAPEPSGAGDRSEGGVHHRLGHRPGGTVAAPLMLSGQAPLFFPSGKRGACARQYFIRQYRCGSYLWQCRT